MHHSIRSNLIYSLRREHLTEETLSVISGTGSCLHQRFTTFLPVLVLFLTLLEDLSLAIGSFFLSFDLSILDVLLLLDKHGIGLSGLSLKFGIIGLLLLLLQLLFDLQLFLFFKTQVLRIRRGGIGFASALGLCD